MFIISELCDGWIVPHDIFKFDLNNTLLEIFLVKRIALF